MSSMKQAEIKIEIRDMIKTVNNVGPIKPATLESDIQYLKTCVMYLVYDNEALKRELKHGTKG